MSSYQNIFPYALHCLRNGFCSRECRSRTLALDHRLSPPDTATFLLTALRRQELQQWLHCLHQADLQPQVVDITPYALRVMALAAKLPAAARLLHRLDHD